jgi:xylulokinase
MSEYFFLGLDLSTQQLKALLIDEKAVVVHDRAVGYDRDLPQYRTTNGATHGPAEGQVTSPVAMWVEALDLILQRMKDAGVDFGRIRAVSGAGQVLLLSMLVRKMIA